jgi:hypothetical protein
LYHHKGARREKRERTPNQPICLKLFIYFPFVVNFGCFLGMEKSPGKRKNPSKSQHPEIEKLPREGLCSPVTQARSTTRFWMVDGFSAFFVTSKIFVVSKILCVNLTLFFIPPQYPQNLAFFLLNLAAFETINLV